MYNKLYIVVLFLLSTYSCDYFRLRNSSDSDQIVASVGSNHLYKRDLLFLYEGELADKDSLMITNTFIENWAKKQVILQKARFNISEEKEEKLKEMLDNYRDDLYINSYKNALVAQNLDTLISSKAINDFFTDNQNVFRLKEEILQFKYLSFNTESTNVSNIKKQFLKPNNTDLDSILFNDLKYSINQLNDSIWFTYKDFINFNDTFNRLEKNKVLKKNHFIEIKDSVNTHFINIVDFKSRNEIAPLEHVTPIIKQMILHKKKLEYINELDNKLIEEAIKNNTFKRY